MTVMASGNKGSHESGLLYARTWSATKRHLQNPDNTSKTLCGGRVAIAEIYEGEDGQPVRMPIERLFMEISEQKPMCDRCAKSAARR